MKSMKRMRILVYIDTCLATIRFQLKESVKLIPMEVQVSMWG